MAEYNEDLKNLDKALTYREMFQQILRNIEEMKDERADDRDIWIKAFDDFKESQKKQDDCFNDHLKDYNEIVMPGLQKANIVIKIATVIGSLILTGIITFLVLIATGQIQLIRV